MKKYILLAGIATFIFGGIIYHTIDKRPLVSVVMPTYNRIGMLPRSIDSILNQTYDKFEFIIVDDASTDGSWELLTSYANLDNRIKLIKNETNKGISYSRNKGTDAAKGKYVAIMDSDDISLPSRIEEHVKFLEEHDEFVALNALYHVIGKEHKGTNNWVPPARFDVIFHLRNYFTNIAFFRTDFVRKHHIRYNENLISSEDYDFWSQIFMKGGKFAMLNKHLANLRRHTSNSKKYYKAIQENAQIVREKLLKRIGIENPANLKSDCEILKAMIDANKKTNKVDQYTLELTFNRRCEAEYTPMNAFYVKHLKFVDYLLPSDEKNVFLRKRNGDKYILLNQQDNFYTFKTPDGKIEVYNKQEDTALALYEEKE